MALFQEHNRITLSPGEVMRWLEHVDESIFLRQLYPEVDPDLSCVRLHELQLHQDGPRVILRFDLTEFPSAPPPKWRAAQSNIVQVRLMGIGVAAIRIAGWAANNLGSMRIERGGSGIDIEFSSAECRAIATVEHLRVDSVSAYRAESRINYPGCGPG